MRDREDPILLIHLHRLFVVNRTMAPRKVLQRAVPNNARRNVRTTSMDTLITCILLRLIILLMGCLLPMDTLVITTMRNTIVLQRKLAWLGRNVTPRGMNLKKLQPRRSESKRARWKKKKRHPWKRKRVSKKKKRKKRTRRTPRRKKSLQETKGKRKILKASLKRSVLWTRMESLSSRLLRLSMERTREMSPQARAFSKS